MSKKRHRWDSELELPRIAEHSIVKHRLLKQYLSRYIKTLTNNPRQEELKLTLVDGFAGGGLYVDEKTEEIHPGSPLILLKTVEEERARLIATRRKEYNLDVDYIFIEKNKKAFEYLTNTIKSSVWKNLIGNKITLINGTFSENTTSIIESIKTRSKRTQRSIFVLDQCGYTQVPLHQIKEIFDTLNNAEVILTFATDFLIDYLSDSDASIKIQKKLGIDLPSIDYKNERSMREWRKIIQLVLHREIPDKTNAKHFTPFFIRSEESHRDLWLMHLSKHHKARDVMTEIHWEESNAFTHYAGTGLNMLGYEPNNQFAAEQLILPKFCFDETALAASTETLFNQIPRYLHAIPEMKCIDFFTSNVNELPVTYAQLKSVMQALSSEGLILIKDGKTNKLTQRMPHDDDLIKINNQKRLFLPPE